MSRGLLGGAGPVRRTDGFRRSRNWLFISCWRYWLWVLRQGWGLGSARLLGLGFGRVIIPLHRLGLRRIGSEDGSWETQSCGKGGGREEQRQRRCRGSLLGYLPRDPLRFQLGDGSAASFADMSRHHHCINQPALSHRPFRKCGLH